MSMFERILVPLDGSDMAELALPFAEEIAGKLGSEIVLLHISESPLPDQRRALQFYIQQAAETTGQHAQTHIDAASEWAVCVRPVTMSGRPATEILDYAERENIGLIVMATHGRSGVKRWLLGSIASKVVRAAECPVVLIRGTTPQDELRERGALKRVLVPLDGSAESETVVPYIAELAAGLKAEVILFQSVDQAFHVTQPRGTIRTPFSPEEMAPILEEVEISLDRARQVLREKNVTSNIEVRIGDAPEEILKIADEVQADLVAMSTHGRSGLSRWAFGSVAEKVLYAATSPILLVRSTRADHK